MSISGLRSSTDIVTSSNYDFQYWQNNLSYIPPLSIVDQAIIGACAAGAQSIYYRVEADSVEIIRILKHKDLSKAL